MGDVGFCEALPLTEWQIEDPEDRHMVLRREFYFDDGTKRWSAHVGYATDGASIPRALWTAVGSPFVGDYRRAAIVHDVACDDADGDPQLRRAADRMFYRACRAGGCGIVQATILYLGVRIGSIAIAVPMWAPAERQRLTGPRLTRTESEKQMESDFARLGEAVLQTEVPDDVDEIERRVDAALAGIMRLDVAAVEAHAAQLRMAK